MAPGGGASLRAGNVDVAWTPVPGATLYQHSVAVTGRPAAAATGLNTGLFVQVPPAARETRELSGDPAVVFEVAARPGFAPRFVVTADVDEVGRITGPYTILAPAKLRALGAC